MDAGRRARRPILYSSDDVERMAIESSRARLMMHLLRKPEESSSEIGPYLRGKSNESARPSVLKQNFLTYPTLVQGLRWSPSIETYSGDSQTESAESFSVHCNCHECQVNRKYAREPQTSNINTYSLKQNIVRYCDTSTMTRDMKDSGCGVSPLSSTADVNTSDVSISTSDATNVLKILSPKAYTLAPILKKVEFGKETNHRVSINSEETRHKRSDYEDLLKTLTKEPAVTTPLKNNGYSEAQNSRKILYNEGISNLIIANNDSPNFPFHAKQIKSQVKLDSSNRPNLSSKRFGGKNNVIPYAHRTNSKYHYDCKEPNRLYKENDEENVRQLLNISPISPVKKSARSERTHLIKLPRRVLTSV